MKYLIISCLLITSINSFGQNKKETRPPVETKSSHKFGRVSNINFSERIKKFPFNIAVSIQLISFEDQTGGGQLDTATIIYNENMPKSKMATCINPFKESKKLNLIQIDKLTDIWFNYKPIGYSHVTNFGACYSPRNAILFLDEKGKVFDFIEICFSCLHMRSFSNKIAVEEECDHKINMVKEFFKSVGIEYGIIEEKSKLN